MPRKQRFKPSRKQPSNPQQQQAQAEPQQQPEIHPDQVDVETDGPARGRADDSAVEGSH